MHKARHVCTREETRPIIRRKKDSGDGTIREKTKQRWTDCVNRDMRAIGTTKYEVHDKTGWRRISDPTIKWERLEDEDDEEEEEE